MENRPNTARNAEHTQRDAGMDLRLRVLGTAGLAAGLAASSHFDEFVVERLRIVDVVRLSGGREAYVRRIRAVVMRKMDGLWERRASAGDVAVK